MYGNIALTLARRLFWAWLFISVAVGGVVYYYETERMDDRVVDIALSAAQRVDVHTLVHYNEGRTSADALRRLTEEVAQDHFAVVELYDRKKQKVIEVVPKGMERIEEELKFTRHIFFPDNEVHYEKRFVMEDVVLIVMVPVKTAQGSVEGYLEGVYVVDPKVLDNLRQDIVITVLIAMGVILLTTVVLYPVILSLNREVLKKSQDVLKGNLEMLEVLGSAIAKRDSDTNIHNYRVTLYAVGLAEAAHRGRAEIRDLIAGAFLHDVGKIGISDTILLKPGKLTPEEFETMKTHVALGVDIVHNSEWLRRARDVVEFHHEKFDGSGYMKGLTGEEIPLAARIFAVADVFDALTSRRPYKEPMAVLDALAILERDAGSHFDPSLVAAFVAVGPAIHTQVTNVADEAVVLQLREVVKRYYFG